VVDPEGAEGQLTLGYAENILKLDYTYGLSGGVHKALDCLRVSC